MDFLQAIILGTVQGITEFLPISSDGHLVIADAFLHVELNGPDALGFDILLHCGSLLAILVGFADVWIKLLRGLLKREAAAWWMVMLILLGTVPGVLAGLFLEDIIANDLRTIIAASVGFLVTAACLILGEFIGKRRGDRTAPLGFVGALLIGIAQAAAILPGVSRSGLTVSMGRALGMRRNDALNFSFLLALPIISGVVAKTFIDAASGDVVFPALPVAATGFVTSAVVSLLAVLFLRRFVLRGSFAWFAWYLIPLASLLLLRETGIASLLDAPHAAEAVRNVGAVAVFVFALVEVVPPFSFVSPGVIALIIAGSVAPDLLSLAVFVAAAMAASLLGNVILFLIGRYAGPSLVRALRLPDERKQQGEDMVRRAGVWAIIGGQFVGALRPMVAFAAGVLEMPPLRFFIAAFVGAALWGGAAVGAGYVLRENVTLVVTGVVAISIVTLLVFAVFAFVEWLRVRRRKARS